MQSLTLGMAVHDDYHGAVFTIQAARIFHGNFIKEYVVIDNNPDSRHGKKLADFCEGLKEKGVVYVPLYGVKGTSVPRNMVFETATSEIVFCCDPHILLFPGAMEAVHKYFDSHPGCKELIQGPIAYDPLDGFSTHLDFNVWGHDIWGQWSTDHVQFARGKPFEIEGNGLGLFGCRKDAWLGFHPEARGFGGEEGYIHQKFRRAGRRIMCIPQLIWWHRFGRPEGTTYALSDYDKCRNYVLGFKDLGMPLDRVYAHFVLDKSPEGGKISEEDWQFLKEGKFPPHVEAQNKNENCGGCSGSPRTIEQWYKWAADTPSDINEHIPTLRDLAAKCDVVVEFGVRTGVSTAGLLGGKPKELYSYDVNDSAEVREMAKQIRVEKYSTRYEFAVGDSLAVDIPECDLLFIDTKHTYEHCYRELSLHHTKVRKYIAFHDTEIFGERGEDGSPGLRHAVRRFIAEHPEWHTIQHYANNNGFTVISRLEEDKPPMLPSTWRMAANLFKSTLKDLRNGLARVPLEVSEERYKICTSNGGRCPLEQRRIDDDRCAGCGCYLQKMHNNVLGKVHRPLDACPFGLWGNYKPDEVVPE